MRLKVNEALAVARSQGKRILKKDLAVLLWPDSSPRAQEANMANLCAGATKTIRPEWVQTICEETGVSADFLFDRPYSAWNPAPKIPTGPGGLCVEMKDDYL